MDSTVFAMFNNIHVVAVWLVVIMTTQLISQCEPTTDNLNDVGISSLAYVGVGYNLLNGNPAKFHGDPGYILNQQVFQVPESLTDVDYHKSATCSQSLNWSVILNSGMAYQQMLLDHFTETTDYLHNDAFTLNPEFLEQVELFNKDSKTLYKDVWSTCEDETAHIPTIDSSNVHVTRAFAIDVCSLNPRSTDLHAYFKLIDSWGTNIVTGVRLGQATLKRYRTNVKEVFNLVQKHNPELIQQRDMTLNIEFPALERTFSANTTIGRLESTKDYGSAVNPVPVHTRLVPLSEALNSLHWENWLQQLASDGTCPKLVNMVVLRGIQSRLEEALRQYSDYRTNASSTKYSFRSLSVPRTLTKPLLWPRGIYTLMKAATGCPGAQTQWDVGSLFQDTENEDSNNYYTGNINQVLDGSFHSNNIRTNYCTKTSAVNIEFELDWPPGHYCIMRKWGVCPTGFNNGMLFWDDEDYNGRTGNSHWGTLPDGIFDKWDTTIYYCCRSDGSASMAISLPTDRPFVLHKYGSPCQQVNGMSFVEAHLRWDDEDGDNKDSWSGSYPLDTGGSEDHLLHFCFYQSNGGSTVIG